MHISLAHQLLSYKNMFKEVTEILLVSRAVKSVVYALNL